VTYGYSTTNIQTFSTSAQLLFESIKFTGLAGPSALNGIDSSKITPTISYSSVNNPQNPTNGKSFYYGVSLEGGPLQRNVIGLKFQTGMITGYGGKNIPPYSRFYLGGENDVRGFDFYTIAPFVEIPQATSQPVTFFNPTVLNQQGRPTQQIISVPMIQFFPTRPGGDFQNVGNFEYRIPIAGPVTLTLFNDIGINGILRKSQLALDPAAVSVFQQQYPNPDFPNLKISNNLPIVKGTNFTPHTSAGVELDVVLPIVNAPFRIYYAYNYLRLNQTINGTSGGYFLDDAIKNGLPPGVLQTQIAPFLQTIINANTQHIPANLLEPQHTFRFTVGKTF
jgi:outer membrane protein insertion porin family